jgi:transposase-like protein
MLKKKPGERQTQRRLNPEQVDQLIAEYQTGDSMLQLAKRWGLHRTTVAEHLRRAGVVVKQRGVPPEWLHEAIRLYKDGWSCQRLAERFRCDDETVRQTLKRHGVQLRSPWDRSNTRRKS